MKKICIFTLYDTKGASSKYRILQFVETLKKHFEIETFYFWNNTYVTKYMQDKHKYAAQIFITYLGAFIKRLYQLFFVASKVDIVIFQKTCIPKVNINHINALKKRGIKIVLDIDDAVYVFKRDQTDVIAALSDLVICGNKTLVNHYSKYCKNCVILPTVENTTLFEPFYMDTFQNKKIGWIGSKSTVSNLEIVVDAINRIIDFHPEVTFDIISNTAMDFPSRIKNCRLIKWTEDDYLKGLSQFSVGIMPLENNEVNQGKCGFKLVQCLNMKKPVVASDIGINKDIVGECGLIANSSDEWFTQLEKLLFDKDLYESCVKNIERDFLTRYHFSMISKRLGELLGSLFE